MKPLSRYVTIAVSLMISGALVYYFRDIVTYIVIAWVLSMLGQPLMKFFMKQVRIRHWYAGRNVAAVLVLLCFVLLIGMLISLFVPLIIHEASHLSNVDYTKIADALSQPLHQFYVWVHSMGIDLKEESPVDLVRRALQGWFQPQLFQDALSGFVNAIGGIVVAISSVAFITFFFLKDLGIFTEFLEALVPNQYEKQVRHAIDEIAYMLRRYFFGILIQMTCVTLLVSIPLTLFGIKNALLIGFFGAVMNVIPYVGPIIGCAFGILITISSYLEVDFYTQMLPLLLKVLGTFMFMQFIDNWFMQPAIFSNSVSSHPLEIFLIIMIGAKVGGVVGMVLAIPAYTVLRVIGKVFLSEFKIVQHLTKNLKGEGG